MGENTHISWAHHKFNPWWGCTKISPGCNYCYAVSRANEHRHHEQLWNGNRHIMAESSWKKLRTMDNKAKKAGVQHRVFWGSMCDIADPLGPTSERDRAFASPVLYPHLIHMFLTKRIDRLLQYCLKYWPDGIPNNVWIGFTAEDKACFDERIGHLQKFAGEYPDMTCEKIFMSYEPALEQIDISRGRQMIDLVIAGGERGLNARPADPQWFRSMRDQCAAMGIDFHFKQWGEFYPAGPVRKFNGRISFTNYEGADVSVDHAQKNPAYRRLEKGGPILERVGLYVLEHDGKLDLLDGRTHNGGLN